MNTILKFTTSLGKWFRNSVHNNRYQNSAINAGLPSSIHGDFTPELRQEEGLVDLHTPLYSRVDETIRVRMSYKKQLLELRTKYIPQIHKIVEENAKRVNPKCDLSTMNFNEIEGAMSTILHELAFGIYLQEHRNRYQIEQKNRLEISLKKFSYWYGHKTVEQFIIDYNYFLEYEINRSHNFLSPKIEANFRRNYHDGEVSPVTGLIFHLYFNKDKTKNLLAKILYSAHRNPYLDKQKQLI